MFVSDEGRSLLCRDCRSAGASAGNSHSCWYVRLRITLALDDFAAASLHVTYQAWLLNRVFMRISDHTKVLARDKRIV